MHGTVRQTATVTGRQSKNFENSGSIYWNIKEYNDIRQTVKNVGKVL